MGVKHTWAYNFCEPIFSEPHTTNSDGAYFRAWWKEPAPARLFARPLYDEGDVAAHLKPQMVLVAAIPKYNGLRVIYDHNLGIPAGYKKLPIVGGNTYIDWRDSATIDLFLAHEEQLRTDIASVIDFKDVMIPFGYLNEANFTFHSELLDYLGGYGPIIAANDLLQAEQYNIWGKKLVANLGGIGTFAEPNLIQAAALGIRGFRQDSFGFETIGKMYEQRLTWAGSTFGSVAGGRGVTTPNFDFLFMEVSGFDACTNWPGMGLSFDTMFGDNGECERLRVTAIGDLGPTLGDCVPVFHTNVAAMITTFFGYSLPAITPVNKWTFTFGDTSTTNRTIITWLWDFGDGNTSVLQHPTHQYQASGSYNVTVTVTDDLGASSTSGVSVANTAACPF